MNFWEAPDPAHLSLPPFRKFLSPLRSAPASWSSLGVCGVCTSKGLQFYAEICKPVPLSVQLLPVRSGLRRSPKERTGSSCSWQSTWHPIFKKHKLRHIKLTLSITIHYKKSFQLSLSPQESSQTFLHLISLIHFCWSNLWFYHLQGHHHVEKSRGSLSSGEASRQWPVPQGTSRDDTQPNSLPHYWKLLILSWAAPSGHRTHPGKPGLSSHCTSVATSVTNIRLSSVTEIQTSASFCILPTWKCDSPWLQVAASHLSAARFISPCLPES